MPSSAEKIKFPKKHNQDRIAFNNRKLFIVNGPSKNKENGIYIQVLSLDSGENVKEFLAVSLDRIEERTEEVSSLCTGLQVEGDNLLLTTSHGKIFQLTLLSLNLSPCRVPLLLSTLL